MTSICLSKVLIDRERLQAVWASDTPERKLRTVYGGDPLLLQNRRERIQRIIEAYPRFYQDQKVFILRVPARINLMGVHIDHRGGWCNYLAIPWETFFIGAPREDNRVVLNNLDPQYEPYEFSISQELPPAKRGNWFRLIEESNNEKGCWYNYIKAGAVKLQDTFPKSEIKGINLLIDGDIPPGSGLSSSSTLVVGIVKALMARNRLKIDIQPLVELCGEGEWYVGTRGGAGDHAAILLGQLDAITHTGFHPFTYSYFPFPKEYDIVIIQSGIQAKKATNAREIFNSRIAGYEIAFAIFQSNHPEWRAKLDHLRDISTDRLQISLPELYRSLKTIPERIHPDDLCRRYPSLRREFERIFSVYGRSNEEIPLREILLFGISECERAKQFPHLLSNQSIEQAGDLMYRSHDGDRVTVWNEDRSDSYHIRYTDEYIDRLIRSIDTAGASEQYELRYQPGGYRCSAPALDRIVDFCKTIPGVAGATLTGAGLGGCIVCLTRSERTEEVMGKLSALNLPWIQSCRPIQGASFLQL